MSWGGKGYKSTEASLGTPALLSEPRKVTEPWSPSRMLPSKNTVVEVRTGTPERTE